MTMITRELFQLWTNEWTDRNDRNYLLFLKIYSHKFPDPTSNAETTIPEFSTIVFTNQIDFDQ